MKVVLCPQTHTHNIISRNINVYEFQVKKKTTFIFAFHVRLFWTVLKDNEYYYIAIRKKIEIKN